MKMAPIDDAGLRVRTGNSPQSPRLYQTLPRGLVVSRPFRPCRGVDCRPKDFARPATARPLDAVAAHQAIEGNAIDSQFGGGSLAMPLVAFQGLTKE